MRSKWTPRGESQLEIVIITKVITNSYNNTEEALNENSYGKERFLTIKMAKLWSSSAEILRLEKN